MSVSDPIPAVLFVSVKNGGKSQVAAGLMPEVAGDAVQARVADVSDPPKLSAMLAAQAPAWTLGSRHGYHAVTLG